MSIKKILAPTDFSELADKAVAIAADLAKRANAELHLLHVVHVPIIDPYTTADVINTITDDEKEAAQQQLAKLALTYSDIKPQLHQKLGFVTDEILNFSEENGIDLVVLGTTGASGVEEALIGSNASGVVGKSKSLVLCIPDEMKNFTTTDMVYASDLEKNDFEVMNKLVEVARLYNSNFHVVHVHNDDMDFTNDEPEKLFNEMAERIDYPSLSFHQLEGDNTRELIEDFISKMPCDILAMATHHRSFFDKLFHSSLTKKMVNHSHMPILTYYK